MNIASSESMLRRRSLLLLLAVFIAAPGFAQNILLDTLKRGTTDLAETRRRAEAGDAEAQVTFGDILTSHWRHADALSWYGKAAAQGNAVGQFHVGRTLLNGALGNPSDQSVRADPLQGLRWTFMAATNHNRDAYWDMSHALQRGMGTSVDLVAAYAWLELHYESSPGGYGSRIELNDLALKMTTAEIDRALGLAAQFKAGYWQFPVQSVMLPVAQVIPGGVSHLKLTGVAFGIKHRLAIISGKTLEEGESATISLTPGTLNVKCLKIEKDSVSISIDGEDQPRVLRLTH